MRVAAINTTAANARQPEVTELPKSQATVLLATNDQEIHGSMSDLLQAFPVKTLWARGMEEVKYILAREKVSVCFCGFWLVDGTYRDLVGQLRLRRAEIPAVIVCAPSCPHEYSNYLATLNIRAFDFICHPYRMSDIERILHSAIGAPLRPPSPAPSLPVAEASGLRKAS